MKTKLIVITCLFLTLLSACGGGSSSDSTTNDDVGQLPSDNDPVTPTNPPPETPTCTRTTCSW